MPIVEFENSNEEPLLLVIEPWGEQHEVPHLARAGVRYALQQGAEDRCYSALSRQRIEFWCNADSYEIDIVCASAVEKLMWDICVTGGWCGGTLVGKLHDLLPSSGSVTAQDFAQLTVRADGWPAERPMKEQDLRWLTAKFIEHLGGQSEDAEAFQQVSRRPFEIART